MKVKEDGTVKVLDFGLAKAFQPEASDPNMSMSPTISLTAAATQQGMILGTAAYMSPEQAKGNLVDKRADVWAFGCVLYEMLTTRRVFDATDVSEVLASVLLKDPDFASLPTDVPPGVRSLLTRCLVKEPKDRLRDIGEARLALRSQDAETMSSPVAPAVAAAVPHHTSRRLVFAVLLSVLATAAAAGVAFWSLSTPDTGTVSRFGILPLSSGVLVNGPGTSFVLSPDGGRLVYVASRGQDAQLYSRLLNQFDSVAIAGTNGARAPFFSPDGQWVGFVADGALKKISLAGGPPSTLCPFLGAASGATWGPQETIVFGRRNGGGLMQVSSAGGDPSPLPTVDTDNGEVDHLWPEMTPDGRAVLFTVWSGSVEMAQIAVVSLETGDRTMLTGGTQPRYAPTGHILFARQNSLWRAPFDASTLVLTGPAAPVLEPLQVNVGGGAALYTVAHNGSLMYAVGQGFGVDRSLIWVDREGGEEPLAMDRDLYVQPRVSPDGRMVAFGVFDSDSGDVWIHDLVRGTEARLTTDLAADSDPLWEPSGDRVVFASNRGGQFGLFWKLADGSGNAELLTRGRQGRQLAPSAWSADGETLVYFEGISGNVDISLLTMEGDRPTELQFATEFFEATPVVSPDGRWLAYLSDESGRDEVYVQRFPGLGGRVTISTNGGVQPVWSPDGQELFYRGPSGMMVVPITTGQTFCAGEPEVLFEDRYFGNNAWPRNYDVAPDGRFLMVFADELTNEDDPPLQINVVLNWFDELTKRVPVN